MANTYTQLYFQIVFAVKNRDALIQKPWREKLHGYITGIVQNHGHKMLSINSMPDHVHMLIGYHHTKLLPDLLENVKTSSNDYIKINQLSRFKFEWQKGYGAFSYSRSQIPAVAKYIENQEAHHRKKSFRAEYLELLRKFEVEYDERYVFEFFDDVQGWE
jgi:REP element-mobilizing transposase RayT